jgi:hypothetical protein
MVETAVACSLVFRECVVSIDPTGKVQYDLIATSSHLCLESCEAWMRKGAVIGGIEIHRYDPRNAGHYRDIVQEICTILLRERDIVAVYACTDADGIVYRAITRCEVPVYDAL